MLFVSRFYFDSKSLLFFLTQKRDMSLENDKTEESITEHSLRFVLVNSGFSEDLADKILNWYIPLEGKTIILEKASYIKK